MVNVEGEALVDVLVKDGLIEAVQANLKACPILRPELLFARTHMHYLQHCLKLLMLLRKRIGA